MGFNATFYSTAFNVRNLRNFSPLGQCDITGAIVPYKDLRPYMEWAGYGLYNTGILAYKRFVDKPDGALRTPNVYLDPEPVLNPRPIKNFMPWS